MESKNTSARSQEDLRKELSLMVELVQSYYKAKGVKMTQEDLALKMGKGKKYLSHLINGHENINEGHLHLFQGFFKNELPSGLIDATDLNNITTALRVLERKVAELQEKIPGGVSVAEFLKILKKETEIALIQQSGV